MAKDKLMTLLKNQSQQQGLIEDGPTPLYYQLYTLLKTQIIDGTITYGSKLPTEQELGEEFELSRITVKRAMDELASENMVERRRGRGTTVIYKYKPEPVRAPLVGMLENIETMRRHTSTRLIDIAELIPPAQIKEELNLGDNEAICRMIRVRLTESDEKPFAYYVNWTKVPIEGFTEEALNTKARIEIMKDWGINLSRIDQTISAEITKPEVSKELGLKPESPLLVLVRRSYDTDGNLVDILHSSYNPAIFQYQMSTSLTEDPAV